MLEYSEVVKTENETCFACPLQVEGTLRNAERFFFHYRHGYASLEVGTAEVGREVVNEEDPCADGYLPRSQYEKVFVSLLAEATLKRAGLG